MPSCEERFWSKVRFGPSCWVWQGAKKLGYGQFRLDGRHGKIVQAHRYAYEFCVGLIPVGLQLDHLCRVPSCVNPDDLEVVTSRENTLRGVSPSAQAARRTHCPQGHPYDQENTYVSPQGVRECRECNRRRCRDWYAKRVWASVERGW